jgi:hypothetical protein
MVAEIAINAAGTFVATVIMYFHSRSAYNEKVPKWLLRMTLLSSAGDKDSSPPPEYEQDDELAPKKALLSMVSTVHTTVCCRVGLDRSKNIEQNRVEILNRSKLIENSND